LGKLGHADTVPEAVLLFLFAVLAFLLTAVGLYGVIFCTVVQRTQEMGIRLALGADRNAIVGMVVKSGTLLACAGVLIGLAAASVLTRLVASLLYGVGPTDPLTFLCVPIALVAIGMLASYVPARAVLPWSIRSWRCATSDELPGNRSCDLKNELGFLIGPESLLISSCSSVKYLFPNMNIVPARGA
jgi:FtsX-like permease family